MVQSIAAIAIVMLVYVCLGVIILAPSIYVGWFYVVSRTTPGAGKVSFRTLICTVAANVIVGYFFMYFVYGYIHAHEVEAKDGIAMEAARNAIASQERFFSQHGRYYEVGPVRGPYHDERGVVVKKDVILEVVRIWDKTEGKESFRVHAAHLWGRKLITADSSGAREENLSDSDEAARIRKRLVESVI